MEGYSRLMGMDEAGTLAALGASRALIDPLITANGGRVVGTAGDSLLAEFGSAVAAVACAVAMQRARAERNAPLPDDRRMRFRVGINLGDVMVSGNDIHGDGVNVAVRLERLVEPGGICISRVVLDQIEGRLPVTAEDLGDQTVKNIAKPVRVFRVADAAGEDDPARRRVAPTVGEKASVAILPFANMSGDPEQEYFSDGITAQLIEAVTGNHVWAERYDRELADIFAVQDDVARGIAITVAGRVTAAGISRTHRVPTQNLTAYDNYLRALEFHQMYDGSPQSEPFLLKAIELDPRFALAHAFLSLVNTVRILLHQ
ncbi:MAG: adenylate/guanylate cyclase domain-containing protein [Alphaproteobacteria bacterium]|nr:adenylate/guanylate cyclase domain-containing protein [Alphaproteobacteria bacterium]